MFKTLTKENLDSLYNFLNSSINPFSELYYVPHKADKETLHFVFSQKGLIPLGVFHDEQLIGYGLIRLLVARIALYSIFIAESWQGRGIGSEALKLELSLIDKLGYRPISFVNENNEKSIRMLKKLGVEFGPRLGKSILVKGIRNFEPLQMGIREFKSTLEVLN